MGAVPQAVPGTVHRLHSLRMELRLDGIDSLGRIFKVGSFLKDGASRCHSTRNPHSGSSPGAKPLIKAARREAESQAAGTR